MGSMTYIPVFTTTKNFCKQNQKYIFPGKFAKYFFVFKNLENQRWPFDRLIISTSLHAKKLVVT